MSGKGEVNRRWTREGDETRSDLVLGSHDIFSLGHLLPRSSIVPYAPRLSLVVHSRSLREERSGPRIVTGKRLERGCMERQTRKQRTDEPE